MTPRWRASRRNSSTTTVIPTASSWKACAGTTPGFSGFWDKIWWEYKDGRRVCYPDYKEIS